MGTALPQATARGPHAPFNHASPLVTKIHHNLYNNIRINFYTCDEVQFRVKMHEFLLKPLEP
jgi:hypothetical protein